MIMVALCSPGQAPLVEQELPPLLLPLLRTISPRFPVNKIHDGNPLAFGQSLSTNHLRLPPARQPGPPGPLGSLARLVAPPPAHIFLPIELAGSSSSPALAGRGRLLPPTPLKRRMQMQAPLIRVGRSPPPPPPRAVTSAYNLGQAIARASGWAACWLFGLLARLLACSLARPNPRSPKPKAQSPKVGTSQSPPLDSNAAWHAEHEFTSPLAAPGHVQQSHSLLSSCLSTRARRCRCCAQQRKQQQQQPPMQAAQPP